MPDNKLKFQIYASAYIILNSLVLKMILESLYSSLDLELLNELLSNNNLYDIMLLLKGV